MANPSLTSHSLLRVVYMHYFIYKITNVINGKFYIGKHKTRDLDDGYMGSGKLLIAAQKKYGIENFEKKIIYVCDSESQMDEMERRLVNEKFLRRGDIYNITLGGTGGNRINWESMSKEERHLHGVRSHACITNPGYVRTEKFKKSVSNGLKKAYQETPSKMGMLGKHHTDEAKRKMAERKTADKNYMFGRIWIFNPTIGIAKSINGTDSIPEGWIKGRTYKRERKVFDWKWVSKNGVKKFIRARDLEAYLRDGWLHKRG